MLVTATIEEISDLLAKVIRALVNYPEESRVETIAGEDETRLVVFVHPSDVRMVIGMGGRTARSLRTVLSILSQKHKHRFSLDIPSKRPEVD